MLDDMWRIALAVAVALVVDARAADACSCAFPEPRISPANGAVDVPIDAKLIVRFAIADSIIVSLRDASGAGVALTTDIRRPYGLYDGVTVFATPAAPLAANTTYTVTAHRTDAMETITSFRTGSATDQVPPSFGGITAFAPETMEYPIVINGGFCIATCISASDGHLSRIGIDAASVPADVVHLALLLRRADDTHVEEIPLSLAPPFDLTSDVCLPHARLEAGVDYCARVVAYDVAGNRAGFETELCTTSATCQPTATDSGGCTPADACLPIDPPTAADSGGCASSRPDGLLALVMTAMSWICIRRRPGRRLMREIP